MPWGYLGNAINGDKLKGMGFRETESGMEHYRDHPDYYHLKSDLKKAKERKKAAKANHRSDAPLYIGVFLITFAIPFIVVAILILAR